MLSEQEARDAIIIALDCDRETALDLADKLSGKAVWVKVGMTLFYRYGPVIVDDMRSRGLRVFLDLKLHDIPFQIRGAAHSASLCGADILSIHGLGGAAMIAEGRAGVEEAAAERGGERTRLVAIASLAVGAGSDGIVCSPQEAADMRALLGPDALIVCPGVRPAGAELGDQKRVSTPAAAIAAGASKLVIGRPITHAADPAAAFEAIVEELMS